MRLHGRRTSDLLAAPPFFLQIVLDGLKARMAAAARAK